MVEGALEVEEGDLVEGLEELLFVLFGEGVFFGADLEDEEEGEVTAERFFDALIVEPAGEFAFDSVEGAALCAESLEALFVVEERGIIEDIGGVFEGFGFKKEQGEATEFIGEEGEEGGFFFVFFFLLVDGVFERGGVFEKSVGGLFGGFVLFFKGIEFDESDVEIDIVKAFESLGIAEVAFEPEDGVGVVIELVIAMGDVKDITGVYWLDLVGFSIALESFEEKALRELWVVGFREISAFVGDLSFEEVRVIEAIFVEKERSEGFFGILEGFEADLAEDQEMACGFGTGMKD